MFYGAISTDIKKSSSNWSTFPEWMEKAVMLTNNITEYVFKKYDISSVGGTQTILPNSPEGDAFTLFYKHHDKIELENHLKNVALQIQSLLDQARTKQGTFTGFGKQTSQIRKELKEEVQREYDASRSGITPNHDKLHSYITMHDNIETNFKFIGRIFLRIGIAITKEPPLPYEYNGLPSYRGGVIDYSEKAEQEAPWEYGYGMYNFEKKKVDKIKEKTTSEEQWVSELTKTTQDSDFVCGFMIFVKYEFGITEEEIKKDPHLFRLMREEFRDLHDEANITLGQANLIKVKRDSSSMYFIPNVSNRFNHKSAVELFNKCSKLVSLLPHGSSIGIAYSGSVVEDKDTGARSGPLKEVLRHGATRDMFGATVNLSARMEFMDWSYKTNEGVTDTSSHKNRIAYGDFSEKNIRAMYVATKGRSESDGSVVSYPFQLDRIPVEKLNAGYGKKYFVLSKRLKGPATLHLGSRVRFKKSRRQNEQEGVVVELSVLTSTVMVDGTNELVEVRTRKLVELDKNDAVSEAKEFLNRKYKFKF